MSDGHFIMRSEENKIKWNWDWKTNIDAEVVVNYLMAEHTSVGDCISFLQVLFTTNLRIVCNPVIDGNHIVFEIDITVDGKSYCTIKMFSDSKLKTCEYESGKITMRDALGSLIVYDPYEQPVTIGDVKDIIEENNLDNTIIKKLLEKFGKKND